MKLKMLWAWLRGGTVLVSPEGTGYAAYRGSGEKLDLVADQLRSEGWTDWKPGAR